jgi:pSer/pThr/pTyr-binding forkhead associated (FHA) protein
VQAIAVDDKDRSVSRNHLRLELDARGTVIACDLGSANGTELIGADGNRVTFTAGTWYPVGLGDTIVIGDLALDVV